MIIKGEGKMHPLGDLWSTRPAPVPFSHGSLYGKTDIRYDQIPWPFPFLGWLHSHLEVSLILKSRKIIER